MVSPPDWMVARLICKQCHTLYMAAHCAAQRPEGWSTGGWRQMPPSRLARCARKLAVFEQYTLPSWDQKDKISVGAASRVPQEPRYTVQEHHRPTLASLTLMAAQVRVAVTLTPSASKSA